MGTNFFFGGFLRAGTFYVHMNVFPCPSSSCGVEYPRRRSETAATKAMLPRRRAMAVLQPRTRRGGRVVDGSGLENRQGASPRGFESHPLRHCKNLSPTSLACSRLTVMTLWRFEQGSTGEGASAARVQIPHSRDH